LKARVLVTELLDILPADDSRAQRSRRDLARINAVMMQQALMARALRRLPPPAMLTDLGSGDGRFMLGVAQRLARHWPVVRVVLADRQNIVSTETRAAFAALGWNCESSTGDVFDTLQQTQGGIVTANLFLHHFDDAALSRLLALAAARSDGFVACEPRRSAFALAASKMVFALGANDVTRHDAVASVRAGFTGGDLSMLWPYAGRWRLAEQAAFPFSHTFTAARDV
jgi:hypothetical protein